jgi:hypothetical protein
MTTHTSKLRRLWQKSPKLAVAYLRRRMTKKAQKLIPAKDDWNLNWLGEEMRPFNSLRQ